MADQQIPVNIPFTLRSIYLRESSTSFHDNFDPLMPGQPLHMRAKFSPTGYFTTGETSSTSGEPTTISYTFLTSFEFDYMAAPASPSGEVDLTAEPVAKIAAKFAVDYLVNPGAPLPDEDFARQWGGSAAMTHAWPYWREFAHNTLTRMNLPVMLIPLLLTTQAAVQSDVLSKQQGVESPPMPTKRQRSKIKPTKR